MDVLDEPHLPRPVGPSMDLDFDTTTIYGAGKMYPLQSCRPPVMDVLDEPHLPRPVGPSMDLDLYTTTIYGAGQM